MGTTVLLGTPGSGAEKRASQRRWKEGVTAAAAPCACTPGDAGDLGPPKLQPRARFGASVGRIVSGCLRLA